MTIEVRRLSAGDGEVARRTVSLMADVFEEPHTELSDAYVDGLLARHEFWLIAAFVDGAVAGGLSAHTLAMTNFEGSEIFLYDIAVDPIHQRRGVGRALVALLTASAADLGIESVFVPADDEDEHALDFYRALGGQPTKTTIFDLPVP